MLSLFSEITHPRLSRSKVTSIDPCKLFFLTRERNAWHSKWVRRYFPASIQLSFYGAAREAEKHRARGTTFVIQELPALRFSSATSQLYVTEINSKDPLEHYSREALHAGVKTGYRTISDARDNYLVHGAPMIGVALSFQPESRFWRKSPPPKNHVLVLGAEEGALKFEQIPSPTKYVPSLWRWHSSSTSGRDLLSWGEAFDDPVNADPVLALCKNNVPTPSNVINLVRPR